MAASVLVCLHGLGRSASDWDGVRPHLEQFGRVVTPALPRDVQRAYRLADAATPDGAILVGHSFGAILAMRLAAEPGRAVAGVVASSSFFPQALNGRSLAATIADYARHRAAFVRGLRGSDRPPGFGNGTVKGLGYLIQTAARGSRFRVTTEAITSAVLVVHAVDDHYVPLNFALAAVARQPSWQLAILAAGGHYPHIQHPVEWLAVVDAWLDRLSARPQ